MRAVESVLLAERFGGVKELESLTAGDSQRFFESSSQDAGPGGVLGLELVWIPFSLALLAVAVVVGWGTFRAFRG